MTRNRKFRPSPAMAISCVALFLALVGTAFAAPKFAVRSAQIVDNTVRTVDLRDNAVKSAKIADATVGAADLGIDSVGTEEIAKDAVKSDEIAENSVASPEVAPDSLTAGDLAANSVGSSEVADESLTQNDLAANSVGSSELQASSVRASELGPITTVTKSTTITPGNNGFVTADCPAGTTVISGGGLTGNYTVPLVGTVRSGNGWSAYARNITANDSTVTAYAYCLAA
ncbi:MAG TPA: hypothetical protein VNP96_05185 [Solirubrobacterales bacterium]|nr:hypothetical protein [Solirubrobacterales bacterium]